MPNAKALQALTKRVGLLRRKTQKTRTLFVFVDETGYTFEGRLYTEAEFKKLAGPDADVFEIKKTENVGKGD